MQDAADGTPPARTLPNWARFARIQPQPIGEMTMFENLEIRNFRLFEHLKMEKLGRVNLVAGMNNSGKTSVLEALFLLCGIGNPELVLRVNAFRGCSELVTPVAVREALLKPLFYHFNSNQSVEISSQSKLHKTMKLIIKVKQKNTVALPLQGASLDNSPKEFVEIPPSIFATSQESVWSDSLHLLYSSDSDKVINEGYIHMTNEGMQVIASSRASLNKRWCVCQDGVRECDLAGGPLAWRGLGGALRTLSRRARSARRGERSFWSGWRC